MFYYPENEHEFRWAWKREDLEGVQRGEYYTQNVRYEFFKNINIIKKNLENLSTLKFPEPDKLSIEF